MFVLVNLPVQAGERVKTYWMADSTGNLPTYPDWVQVDSSGTRSIWLYFTPYPRNAQVVTTDYTGAATVVIYFDSAAVEAGHTAANLDTVDVIGTLLFWNRLTGIYAERAKPVSGDTVHIATNFKYRVGLNDGEYSISYVWNFRSGVDAIKLNFGTNLKTNPYRARAEARITEDR